MLGLQLDEKGGRLAGHSSDDCASFEYYNAARGPFLKFVDGAPLLAVGVLEVDGISSLVPSLLLLIVEL